MKTQATSNNSYTANRTAEITVWILGILVLTLILVGTNSFASTPQLEEEAYINDVPFDTELVVHNLLIAEFAFEDEQYVDDIPFNTASIYAQHLYQKASDETYNLEEETYIKDIPFSTKTIVANYEYKMAMKSEFEMPEEKYVDDIPFSTCLVASNTLSGLHFDVYASTK